MYKDIHILSEYLAQVLVRSPQPVQLFPVMDLVAPCVSERARVDEIEYNKMMFMKILRTLKNVRMRSVGNMVQVLSAVEVDPVFGMLEEMFVPWNPKGLRRSRHERRKDLLRVLVRAWYFSPNSGVVYCHLCELWLNVGQLPDHRNGKRHRDRKMHRCSMSINTLAVDSAT